jgi:hypothetical protein
VDEDLERLIDELYARPLDRFTPERDELAKRLLSTGDRGGSGRVKALRKPVVAAWALNVLAREDPEGIAELGDLGRRLRDAHRRAISGGDAGPFREATEERRALVARLAARANQILERSGAAAASQDEAISATLDAAAVDAAAATALAEGRLTRPMRPPAGFGDAPALTVVPGARASASEPADSGEDARTRARRVGELRRELGTAQTRQRRADAALARAHDLVQDAERRRSEARDGLREAEAERRGAALEVKRLAAALSKLEGSG